MMLSSFFIFLSYILVKSKPKHILCRIICRSRQKRKGKLIMTKISKHFKLQKKTSIERLGLMKQAQIEELIEHIQKMQSRLYRQCEKRIKTNY